MGMARSGDEITSFDYDGSARAQRDGLEDAISRSAAAFRESVLGSLGAEHGESYKGKVLLHPDQVLHLLGQTVTANCNGLWHVDGISAWADRVGERVASDLLSVTEDPHDRALAGSSSDSRLRRYAHHDTHDHQPRDRATTGRTRRARHAL